MSAALSRPRWASTIRRQIDRPSPSNETIQTDVRVIAATNQDLETRIASGEFRQDLLYRLNGFTIRLPALRERVEDLPLLIEHFLSQAQLDAERPAFQLANETLALLETYNWPGNVRELQSVIKYAVVHAVGDVITPECLPDACREKSSEGNHADEIDAELAGVAALVRRMLRAEEPDVYRRLLGHVDRIALRETLRHVGGNQVHASRRLGVSRSTLRSKLQHLEQQTQR